MTYVIPLLLCTLLYSLIAFPVLLDPYDHQNNNKKEKGNKNQDVKQNSVIPRTGRVLTHAHIFLGQTIEVIVDPARIGIQGLDS